MKSADASILADASAEIQMLRSEQSKLRLRIRTLQETVDNMTARNAQLLVDLQASSIVDTAGGMLRIGLLSVVMRLHKFCMHYSEEIEHCKCPVLGTVRSKRCAICLMT